MKKNISRREFLKLVTTLPLAYYSSQIVSKNLLAGNKKKNVLIVVFDAWSSFHLPLFGYPRNTTPAMNALADRAIVYHNHISESNYTTPGVTSLLTSMQTWTHRAFHLGLPVKHVLRQNIFNAFGSHYFRLAYSHNPQAMRILQKFNKDLDYLIPMDELYLVGDWVNRIFKNDYDIAALSTNVVYIQKVDQNSLYFSNVYDKFVSQPRVEKFEPLTELFPFGIPSRGKNNYFLLEDGIDWLIANLNEQPEPYLAYFHFLPPHAKYTTRREFAHFFENDSYTPVEKPQHLFNRQKTDEVLLKERLRYDEYILYVDAEFQRLFDFLDRSGSLENTWVVLTSDHGEMFERGVRGHSTELLYDPVVEVPLLIFEPGNTTRRDIYQRTSSLDILPTLLHNTSQPIPEWSEGEILPPFGETNPNHKRSLYAVYARDNQQNKPIEKATIALYQGPYKLIAYFGYEELSSDEIMYELYDLENDPEELVDLFSSNPEFAKPMIEELLEKIEEVKKPYS
jgi:arylsulfatase A-like enzyme